MKKNVTVLVAGLLAGLADAVQANLIAYEGFRTTAAAEDYTAGNFLNQKPVVGNFGFNDTMGWVGNTGALNVTDLPFSHSALVGPAESGSARIYSQAGGRGVSRSLAASPVGSTVYYMSGLVNLVSEARVPENEYRTAGFMGTTVSTSPVSHADGMHYGLRNVGGTVYLAAWAGGSAYNIAPLPSTGVTYQVVLKLDVNAGGTDTLSAWYSAHGDTELTKGFIGQAVETWSKVDDLRRLTLQTGGTGTSTTLFTSFDEIYLGTALSDVTVLSGSSMISLIIIQ